MTIPVEDARLIVDELRRHGEDGSLYRYRTSADRIEKAIGEGWTVSLETQGDALALLRVLDHLRNRKASCLRDTNAAWRVRGAIIGGFGIEPILYELLLRPAHGLQERHRFASYSGPYPVGDILVPPTGEQWRVFAIEDSEEEHIQTLVCDPCENA